jgi:pimeloyl-ACP methyl ester carboxylesterase
MPRSHLVDLPLKLANMRPLLNGQRRQLRVPLVGMLLFAFAVLAACHALPLVTSPTQIPPATDGLRVDTGFASVDGARLYYESAGTGPPVILLHGGNLDHRMWDSQFVALAREHRVVRYDARGFGRSKWDTVPYQAHEDLLALLNILKIPRASLVGLSLGGRVAIDFALAHPLMVDRLVLASPGLSGWQFARGDTTWLIDARAARDRGDSVGVAVAWLENDYMKPAMEHPELRARLREMAGTNASYWMSLVRRGDPERATDPPALGRTALIHTPTLLIVGARDVPDILRIADTLSVTIPGLRRITFTGAGHMVNLERSTRFTKLVSEFLRP